jgi:membrane protein DedA with SNARE-associated domain
MVDWWTEVGLATTQFLDRHGLLAAFVLLLIEEAGVPVPVPGDLAMLALGVNARHNEFPVTALMESVGATWAGTIAGSTFLYFMCRWAGRELVYRYGRFIRLTPERLDTGERWLNQHGTRAVFVGRLVPGLRILTTVACGVFEVPFRIFFPAMILGALVYIGVYTLLGYFLGPPVLDLLEKIHLPFSLLGSLVPLAVLLWWTIRARQEMGKRGAVATRVERDVLLQAGAIAGLLATVGSTLVLNVVINLAGGIAFNAPGTLVERTAARLAFAVARDVSPVFLFIAVPAYLAVGVLWGVIYAVWGEARLPSQWADWQRGVFYAALPLLVSVLVVLPILGLGVLGFGVTGPVAFTGELIRHAVFGALLGLIFPVFRARRPIKVRPHTPSELAPESSVRAEA